MKAIIKENGLSNGRNYADNKETVSCYSVVGKIKGKLREVVTARAYMGRSNNSSTVYASLWVHGDDVYCSGKGSAGGYGYHKESAAFEEAIRNAGIELYGNPYTSRYYPDTPEGRAEKRKAEKQHCHIGGVGSSAMRAAFEAIALAAGAKGELLYITH